MKRLSIKDSVLGWFFLCWPLCALDLSYNGSFTQTYLHTTGNQEDYDQIFKNTDEGSWKFTEIMLGTSLQVNEKLRVGVQGISRVYGSYGNYDLRLDWGYVDYRFNKYIGLRLGRVKNPIGFHNEFADVDSARIGVLLSQDIYSESNRSFVNAADGVSLYGGLEKDEWGTLDYTLSFGTLDVPHDFILNEYFNINGLMSSSEFQGEWLASFHLLYGAPWGSLLDGVKAAFSHTEFRGDAQITPSIALPGASSPYDFTYDVSATVFSLGYEQFDYSLGAEFLYMQLGPEIPGQVHSAYALVANPPYGTIWDQFLTELGRDKKAFSLYGSYQFTEQYALQLMWSRNDTRDGKAEDSDTWTFSHRYDFSENIMGKVEYRQIYDERGKWGALLMRMGYSF